MQTAMETAGETAGETTMYILIDAVIDAVIDAIIIKSNSKLSRQAEYISSRVVLSRVISSRV